MGQHMAQPHRVLQAAGGQVDGRMQQPKEAGGEKALHHKDRQGAVGDGGRLRPAPQHMAEAGIGGQEPGCHGNGARQIDPAASGGEQLGKGGPGHAALGLVVQGFPVGAGEGPHVDAPGLILLHHLGVGILKGLGGQGQFPHGLNGLNGGGLPGLIGQREDAEGALPQLKGHQQPHRHQQPQCVLEPQADVAPQQRPQQDQCQNEDAGSQQDRSHFVPSSALRKMA